MRKLLLSFILLTLSTSSFGYKQFTNGVTIGDYKRTDDSAVLELYSTTQGFLPPRMTTAERDAIVSPAIGLMIFNTDTGHLETFFGTFWVVAGAENLQSTYDLSPDGDIQLSPTIGGIALYDSVAPISGPLFQVLDSSLTSLLAIDSTGTSTVKLTVDNLTLDGNSITSSSTVFATPNDFNVGGTMLSSTAVVGIGVLDNSSIFDTFSSNHGTRPCPSMSEVQRDLIAAPASGLCIYNTTANKLNVYDGTQWGEVGGGGLSAWLTATDYKTGDVVHESDKIYRALSDHTSSSFNTDYTSNGYWTEMSDDLNRLSSAVDRSVVVWNGTSGDNVIYSSVSISPSGVVNIPGISTGLPLKLDGVSNLISGQVELTSEVTGVLSIVYGGTNSSTALNNDRIMVSSGGAIVEAAALSDGQFLIGSTGAAPSAANLTGTLNQVNVTNGPGSITLSLPQDIHSAATPTFTNASFSSLNTNEFVLTDGSGLLVSSATVNVNSLSGVVPISLGGTNSGTALFNNRLTWTSAGSIVEADALADGQLFIGSTGSAPVASSLSGTTNQVNIANGSGSITISLPQDIDSGASPTFADVTLTSLNPNELVLTDNSGLLVSTSLSGTSNQVYLTSTPGQITLSLPQDIDTGAVPTFLNAQFTSLSPSKVVATDALGNLVSTDVDLGGLSGIVPMSNGGTSANLTPDAGAVVYSTNTSLQLSAVGSAGQALISSGTNAPTWFNPADSAVIYSNNGALADDAANLSYNSTLTALYLDDLSLDGSTLSTTAASTSLYLAPTADLVVQADRALQEKDGLFNEIGKEFRSIHNIYTSGNADYGQVAGFNVGNNATFDGGGALTGLFAIQTGSSSVIDGSRAYEYSSISLNDYIASEDINVPVGYRGTYMGVSGFYTYDGSSGDLEFESKCTGGASSGSLLNTAKALDASSVGAKKLSSAIFIPSDCSSVRIGFSAAASNTGKTFRWDELQLHNDPFKETNEETSYRYTASSRAGFGSSGTNSPYFSVVAVNELAGSATVTNNSTDGFYVTANKKLRIAIVPVAANNAGAESICVVKNPALPLASACSTYTSGSIKGGGYTPGSSLVHSAPAFEVLEQGDYLAVVVENTQAGATDKWNVSIVVDDYTPSVEFVGEAPINAYSVEVTSTASPTFSEVESAGAFDDVLVGAASFQVNFTSNFFNAAPSGSCTARGDGTGCRVSDCTVDSCTVTTFSGSTPGLYNFNATFKRSGIDFRPPHLKVSTPIVQTCYLTDEKTSGTAGGTFTCGASWQTRDLNVTSGDCGFLKLDTNVVSVAPGNYKVSAVAPAFDVGYNRTRFHNTTDNTTAVFGMSVMTGDGTVIGSNQAASMPTPLEGNFSITAPKDFELQHRCTGTTRATNGFGLAVSTGDNEVYSILKIERIGL